VHSDELGSDVAHLAHVELRTPKRERSLRFFVEVMGLTVSASFHTHGTPPVDEAAPGLSNAVG
jgi:catechol 2,3-dioxygenase-like lactoylglutathione lyase family enzyme